MPVGSPFVDSRKLLRCLVINRYQRTSTRFVEFDAFKLWEYLMKTEHGRKVTDPRLCLWVHADEFGEHAAVFERADDVEQVNRIVVDLFDDAYGSSQTVTRDARDTGTPHVARYCARTCRRNCRRQMTAIPT